MIVHLHAATDTAGTSPIQFFLRRRRVLLAERGLYVPEAGLDRLVEELRERAPERVCFSSEMLYPLASDPPALVRLRDALAAIGADVRPLLLFRPQAALIEALYTELVMKGLRESFEGVLAEVLERGSLSYDGSVYELEYHRVAETFAHVFGRDATTALAYPDEGGAERLVATLLSTVLPGGEDLDLSEVGEWEAGTAPIGFRHVASSLVANRGDASGAFEVVLDEMMREKVEPLETLLRPHGRYWSGTFEPLSVDDVARLYSRFGDGNRILHAAYGVDIPVCSPARLFDEVRSRR